MTSLEELKFIIDPKLYAYLEGLEAKVDGRKPKNQAYNKGKKE